MTKKMKSTLLGLCANDTFCLVSRGGACCCRQLLRNVSDYCLADVIDVADEGDCFSKLEAFEEGFEEEDEDPQPLS